MGESREYVQRMGRMTICRGIVFWVSKWMQGCYAEIPQVKNICRLSIKTTICFLSSSFNNPVSTRCKNSEPYSLIVSQYPDQVYVHRETEFAGLLLLDRGCSFCEQSSESIGVPPLLICNTSDISWRFR
jgi:hypothetical protein